MTKGSITHQKMAFLRYELSSNCSRRQKVALQNLCQLARSGLTLRPEVKPQFENMVAGLIVNSSDVKVVRWGLNAIARIGTVSNTIESVKFALQVHQEDPEIVAAGVSALAALYHGRIPAEVDMSTIDPATRILAEMQTVAPRLLNADSLSINIDSANPSLLKLALILVGLNRDIQHLLHPRHENGDIVRDLGQHDDPIVRQYSVWSVIENRHLGIEHLGIPFTELESQPPNVQSKLLHLGASSVVDPMERQELIISGSNLPALEAREGLANSLTHQFYEGLQDVTISWAQTETEQRVLLPLAEHFARYAAEVPSYRDEAMAFFERGPEFCERVRVGAEGTTLYAEVRLGFDHLPNLFDEETDVQRRVIMQNLKKAKELRVLMLNATPDPPTPVDPECIPIRPDKEAMELRERMAGIKNPRCHFALEIVSATRPDQIQQEMVRHDANILHFSGHGSGGKLVFEDRDGREAPVSAELLAQIVRSYGKLECLVLHACFTDDIAKACSAHVQHVVGTNDSIDDLTAPNFTYMFYQAIATGQPYRKAFEMGQTEVALVNKSEALKYTFHSS